MAHSIPQPDPYPINIDQPSDMVELEMAATRRRMFLDEIQFPTQLPMTVREQKLRLEGANDVNEDIYDILENIIDTFVLES